MTTNENPNEPKRDRGVALILVLLAILVLTTLAAAMVFSARTNTLASYNYRIGTQAEYAAMAGVQRALNFFDNQGTASMTTPYYSPVNPLPEATLETVYSFPTVSSAVSPYAENPVNLFFTNLTPVQCQSTAPGCSAGNVTLGTSTGSSNYPNNSGATPVLMNTTTTFNVVSNWVNDVNGGAVGYTTISDGMGGSGTFSVTAQLLDYHTVNDALFGIAATDPRCSVDPDVGNGICRLPYEVWQVTSTGRWNSNVGAGADTPTVVINATIAPMYSSYFGNALYGLCSVTMGGTGTCTDSYNSAYGQYGGSPNSCPPTAGTNNASWSNSPVGSNGGITLNGNVQVGGNLSYADASSPSSCNSGFKGSTSGVEGTVLPGAPIPTPPSPPWSTWGYNTSTGSAPPSAVPIKPISGGSATYRVVDIFLKTNAMAMTNFVAGGYSPTAASTCASAISTGYTAVAVSYNTNSSGGFANGPTCTGIPTVSGITGTPGPSNPYILGTVQDSNGSGTSVLNFIVPPNGLANPTAVVASSVSLGSGNMINISDTTPQYFLTARFNPVPTSVTSPPYPAITFDVATTASLSSTATMNYNSGSPGLPPPDTLALNLGGSSTSCSSSPTLSLSGQSDMSAIVTLPNGSASLSGSGAGGTFFGSILSSMICDSGHYAVHYDLSAKSQSGELFTPQTMSVVRPSM